MGGPFREPRREARREESPRGPFTEPRRELRREAPNTQPNRNVQEHNVDAPAAIEECALCRQQKSIIRFLPCGDTGVCQDCSQNWSHCWKCNMEIQSRVPKILSGNLPGNGSECVVCTEPI